MFPLMAAFHTCCSLVFWASWRPPERASVNFSKVRTLYQQGNIPYHPRDPRSTGSNDLFLLAKVSPTASYQIRKKTHLQQMTFRVKAREEKRSRRCVDEERGKVGERTTWARTRVAACRHLPVGRSISRPARARPFLPPRPPPSTSPRCPPRAPSASPIPRRRSRPLAPRVRNCARSLNRSARTSPINRLPSQ